MRSERHSGPPSGKKVSHPLVKDLSDDKFRIIYTNRSAKDSDIVKWNSMNTILSKCSDEKRAAIALWTNGSVLSATKF